MRRVVVPGGLETVHWNVGNVQRAATVDHDLRLAQTGSGSQDHGVRQQVEVCAVGGVHVGDDGAGVASAGHDVGQVHVQRVFDTHHGDQAVAGDGQARGIFSEDDQAGACRHFDGDVGGVQRELGQRGEVHIAGDGQRHVVKRNRTGTQDHVVRQRQGGILEDPSAACQQGRCGWHAIHNGLTQHTKGGGFAATDKGEGIGRTVVAAVDLGNDAQVDDA